MVERTKCPGAHRRVEIALVGKYVGLHDAYLSVAESLTHAGTACDAKVDIRWVDCGDADRGERGPRCWLAARGMLVPGRLWRAGALRE